MTEIYSEKWGVIVNPVAGKRRLRKEWINIYRTLKRAAIQFSVQSTEYPGHATEIAQNLIKTGFRKILVIGGDGTLNETVNGIFNSTTGKTTEITLALIPYGTGNDWARYCGLNRLSRKQIVDVLYQRNTIKVDIGRMSYTQDQKPRTQYFINGAGFGFDGLVVDITNRLKRIFGGHAWVYSLSLLISIFQYKSAHFIIESKNHRIDDKIFTMSIGNGCYSGGGLKQTDGIPTDGLFFVTSIHRPTFLKIIHGLNLLFKDQLYLHPLAEVIETDSFTVTTQNQNIETDGIEIQGDGTYHFSIIPQAINMVIKKNE